MPAIDLPRVRGQAQRIADRLDQPPAFLTELRTVLDEYAEPAYRSTRVGVEPAWRTRGTREPVMKAIGLALREAARARVPAALRVLPQMWAVGYREERALAAEMLGAIGSLDPKDTLRLLETWVASLDSAGATDTLATQGMGPLLAAEPSTAFPALKGWLSSPSRYARRFVVMSLLPLAEDKKLQRLPELFEVLAAAVTLSDVDVRSASVRVLHALSERSPVEVARFLRDCLATGSPNAAWVVRRALVKLPQEEQMEIRTQLRPGG